MSLPTENSPAGTGYQITRGGFEAARSLSADPRRGLHGHSFQVWLCARHEASAADRDGADLTGLLQDRLAPLGHGMLNELLPEPDDGKLLLYIRRQLALTYRHCLRLQSAHGQGTCLLEEGEIQTWRRFHIEAAHQLPQVPETHRCRRMHGHGFGITVRCTGETGTLRQLEQACSPLQEQLHHSCLNEQQGLENPTSEMLARWFWRRLQPALPRLREIGVRETPSTGCLYDGKDFRIWKELRFEAALRAPGSEQSWHGHSYLLRLHLAPPLDETSGWTMDFGEIKQRFLPVYRSLDHQQLDLLPEFRNTGAAALPRWIQQRAAQYLPQLERLELYETPQRGYAVGTACGRSVLPI